MELLIQTLHVLTCLALIAVVLLQHGKGADIGVQFGGGGSQTVFGARGAGNFLTKLTTGAAVLFMVTSFSLTRLSASSQYDDLLDGPAPASAPDAPIEPAVPESSFEAIPLPGDEPGEAPSGFEAIEPPAPGDAPAEPEAPATTD